MYSFSSFQKSIEMRERPLKKVCLDSTDVFILDMGNMVYQVILLIID